MQSFKRKEKARRYAMQALYGWLLSGNSLQSIEQHYRQDRNPKKFDLPYFQRLLHGIPSNLAKLDALITPYTSRELTTIDPIELTVLRIACYEISLCHETPSRVIIDEALELAKMFGAKDSHRFVNSILDQIAKQLRTNEFTLTEHTQHNEASLHIVKTAT